MTEVDKRACFLIFEYKQESLLSPLSKTGCRQSFGIVISVP